MSSSLSFIPRKLAKASNASKPTTNILKNHIGTVSSLTTAPIPPPKPSEREKPSIHSDTDYANLVALTLSDYVLWVDGDLRRQLGIGLKESTSNNDSDGYVSLNHLFERSAVLASALDEYPGPESSSTRAKAQMALAKASRTHASHLVSVRLLLHPDKIVPRFGKRKDIGGGYEIGRKRKGLVVRGKAEWDACTLYVENISPRYRSHAGIIRFLNCLLHDATPPSSSSAFPTDPLTHVQGISFPPHHNDKPDARPSCKGFALVTFAHPTHCEYLLKHWPWFQISTEDVTDAGTSSEVVEGREDSQMGEAMDEARRFNFRTITKQRWLELKAEYMAYRQTLVGKINAHQDAQEIPQVETRQLKEELSTSQTETNGPATIPASQNNIGSVEPQARPLINPFAPYPPDCLVFVKHVHPETTKTTLRHFFSQAFKSRTDNAAQQSVDGLDYVDFTKGMDTCYIRLASPTHTRALVDYFTQSGHRIAQVSGLDETGTDLSVSNDVPNLVPITMERVTGRPEEFYWDKVPVKVRKAAVEKAVKLLVTVDGSLWSMGSGVGQKRQVSAESGREGNTDTKKRKKQRKG